MIGYVYGLVAFLFVIAFAGPHLSTSSSDAVEADASIETISDPTQEEMKPVTETVDEDLSEPSDNRAAIGEAAANFEEINGQSFDALEPHTNIQKVVSPMGFEAWLVEEYAVPLIAIEVGFHGGARRDPVGKEGLARMVTALLDEGAGPYSSQDFQKRLEDLAVRMSFTSGRDGLYGSVRTIADKRDEALELFRLALTEPRFDEEPVNRIRQQLFSSIKQDESNPNMIAQKVWFEQVLGDHLYARQVKGTREGLATITQDDLKAFVAQSFARDNLRVSVVGAISADELAPLLDKTFGGLLEKSEVENVSEASVGAVGQMLVFEREQPQSVVVFGSRGLKIEDPDFIPAYVMNYILGGGSFSSRLMEEVREKRGLAYGIYTQLLPLDYGALYFGSVGTENGRIKETIDIIKAEYSRLAEEGVSEQELKDAKTYLTGSFPLRFDSNGKIANQLAGFQLSGRGIEYINDRNGLIEAVTADDIKRVAERLLQPEALTFVVVGKPEGLPSENVTIVN